MAISEQQFSKFVRYKEEKGGGDDDNENGGFETESCGSEDSENDPTFDVLEETRANFSRLSIKNKSKARIDKGAGLESEVDPDEVEVVVPVLDEKDEKSFEKVQKTIEAGQLDKLKVDQCKVYLRKNGLRLTGNKDTLIQRIKEHLEIMNGGGEKKYPVSSFVLNCKGDSCTGDVVMFEQNVYEMFNLAARSASGPPCGTRIVAGRIVKESYGAAKQQHTFTIEVLWSKGEKPLPPLHPLLIKGRNLYRLKTLRQRWEDEGERQKVLMEKHSRGSLARSDREARILEKEMRKMHKAKRVPEEGELHRKQARLDPTKSGKPAMQPQQKHIQQQEQNPQLEHGKPRLSVSQSHPNLTEYGNSSTCKENIEFEQSNTEKSCRGIQKVQRQTDDEFQANYRPNSHPNDGQSLFNSYSTKFPPLVAQNRQPLTSTNRCHSPMSPTKRQPLKSMNHYPPMSPSRRHPSTSMKRCSPMSPTNRQSSTNLNHYRPMSPTGRHPSTSMKHYPPMSATNRQCSANLNHYPPVSPTKRHPSTSMNHYFPMSPTRRHPSTNSSHYPPMSSPRREPYKSIDYYTSMSPKQSQCHIQRQPCRYYAQGRCYFGEDCKFSHNLREERGQGRRAQSRPYY